MDQSENPAGKSPRRELQGPRPAPLKVRKDSHKIRKPPMAPSQHHHHPPQAPPRPPVIIYTVSPKVIHANPSEFMTLVQRLTGPDHNSTCSTSATAMSSSSSSSFFPFQDNMNTGEISPAVRFASIEKTRTPEGKKLQQICDMGNNMVHEGIEFGTEIERSGFFPGILSPNPSSLPPIPPNFFSPPSHDPNPLGGNIEERLVICASKFFNVEDGTEGAKMKFPMFCKGGETAARLSKRTDKYLSDLLNEKMNPFVQNVNQQNERTVPEIYKKS
ncbi:hypothetical protein RND71_039404 [Anisodus tanguticus]|uniref:VQ domain-containing protein n=1 Tax=Anisodus tanguticus TaxID=243964 RepID=A0AAE1QWJ2_9SOLA|nr:hypothetical protein RND71_039404 [Anisodus tanguticus]